MTVRARVAVAGLAASALVAVAMPSAATADTPLVTSYEMNEPAEATVMREAGGSGVNGLIDQSGLDTGVEFDGAVGYSWPRRAPNLAPASPERVIQVPDNARLDPGTGSFTVEIRFRTKENFGNIIQKGQSAAKGGQWKIQNPQGMPSCLFKDAAGNRVATRVKAPINDNLWHVLTCVRTPTSVTAYVDGVFSNRKNGSTGTIDNQVQMTVGGKINCDQIETTCDYFSGMIDYFRITKG